MAGMNPAIPEGVNEVFLGGEKMQLEQLGSIKVFCSPNIRQLRQFRFPRSKKKRIRRKWAKRPENSRFFPWVVKMGRDTYLMHPEFYARLKRDAILDAVFAPLR